MTKPTCKLPWKVHTSTNLDGYHRIFDGEGKFICDGDLDYLHTICEAVNNYERIKSCLEPVNPTTENVGKL